MSCVENILLLGRYHYPSNNNNWLKRKTIRYVPERYVLEKMIVPTVQVYIMLGCRSYTQTYTYIIYYYNILYLNGQQVSQVAICTILLDARYSPYIHIGIRTNGCCFDDYRVQLIKINVFNNNYYYYYSVHRVKRIFGLCVCAVGYITH